MIKKKITYNSINLLYPLKHWIILGFLLFIVAKPVVSVIAVITESKYEFYDNLTKENTEEKKEDNSNDEKIHHLFNFKNGATPALSLSYFKNNKRFLSFEPEIHLPPPELYIT